MSFLGSMNSIILYKILMIPGMLIAFAFHEYSHALIADKLGDKTPRFQGRLTLNPITHIDPIGFIAVLLFGFGWAKPVQVNTSAFKNYHKDDLKVSLAGPMANLLVALIVAIIFAFYRRFAFNILPASLAEVLYYMLMLAVDINVSIGLFNLIPVPGLDGFSILRDLSPKTFYRFEEKFYQYQLPIMLLLLYVGGRIIRVPANIIVNAFNSLSSLILSIF